MTKAAFIIACWALAISAGQLIGTLIVQPRERYDKLNTRVAYLECVERQGGSGQQSSVTPVTINAGRVTQPTKATKTGCQPVSP